MKNLLIVLTFFVATSTFSQNKGIKFTDGNWESIVAQAQKENKAIFVDAYATWCGPCKKMVRDVFPDASVGRFYNANFINVKMDMEKGEGIEFAQTYGVDAYPTLLYFDKDGNLTHKTLGYREPPGLILAGKDALSEDRSLMALNKKYESGELSNEQMPTYAYALKGANLDYQKVANQFINKITKDELKNEEAQKFIFSFADDIESPAFKLLLDHQELFNQTFGAEKVNAKISRTAQRNIAQAANTNDKKLLNKIIDIAVASSDNPNTENLILTNFYSRQRNWDKYAKFAIEYIENNEEPDAAMLNNFAWNFYEQVNGKKELKAATKWAKESVKLDPQFYNWDTLAALYFKTKKYGKAKEAAETAIDLAKQTGNDFSGTQELLLQIKQAL